jgi:phospho-acceptor domain-containing protein
VIIQPRQKLYLVTASAVLLLHFVMACFATPSFLLSIIGNAIPCFLLVLAVLSARANFRLSSGTLPLFWKLFAAGLAIMLLSQIYWLYFAWRQPNLAPSPIPADSLFLLAHVFFLTSLALRPHSSSGCDLRIRSLDFLLLSLWWFSLYGYFCLPWQNSRQDFMHYNLTYCVLVLIQQIAIIVALAVLRGKNGAPWRGFYTQFLLAFVSLAAGNLLINLAVERGKYHPGGFYDTPFLIGIFLFTPVAAFGPSLQPREDSKPNSDLVQSVWTARLAMLGTLSLPVISLLGLYEKNLPWDVATFRLRLVFGAMFLLGALVYWKLNLLASELGHMVHLTRDSIENLKSVQQRVTHSEKLIALGRLAAGAAHEISNPLTAIFGYSELLTDIPSLTPEDRANAQLIQKHVHRAQDAVNSLRNTLRQSPSPVPFLIDKKPAS